jgi:hypothetical protein
MFISKSELYCLKETIKHLELRLDNERDNRYKLEKQLSMLLDHLKLEIATYPTKMVIRDKHD